MCDIQVNDSARITVFWKYNFGWKLPMSYLDFFCFDLNGYCLWNSVDAEHVKWNIQVNNSPQIIMLHILHMSWNTISLVEMHQTCLKFCADSKSAGHLRIFLLYLTFNLHPLFPFLVTQMKCNLLMTCKGLSTLAPVIGNCSQNQRQNLLFENAFCWKKVYFKCKNCFLVQHVNISGKPLQWLVIITPSSKMF